MKKFILLFVLVIFINNLNALDPSWVTRCSNFNKEQLFEEINYLKSELKKDRNNSDLLAQIGICYHNLSQQKEKLSKESINYLEKSLNIKNDPVVKVYLGSAYTLKGRDKLDLGAVNKGLKIIDEAYNTVKDNITILIIRISVNAGVPATFLRKRIESIKENIKTIEDLHLNQKISKESYLKVQCLKADIFIKENKKDQAITTWEMIVKDYPETKYAKISKEKLVNIKK